MMILHRVGSATAEEVQKRLPDPPSYSAVRSALGLLERAGIVRHRREGRRYVYHAVRPAASVRTQALDQLVSTFFRGSAVRAAAALMKRADTVGDEEYAELKRLLEELRAGRAGNG